MSMLADGSIAFSNNALIAADDPNEAGINNDSFSFEGMTKQKPVVLPNHGYPLNGSAQFGPWGAQHWSMWSAPDMTIGDTAQIDIYGLVKYGQPRFSPNLIPPPNPHTQFKYHILCGIEEQDPGTSVIVTGILWNTEEWQYFVFAVADKNVLAQFSPMPGLPLDMGSFTLDYNTPWGEVGVDWVTNYRSVPGLGLSIEITDADTVTISGATAAPFTYIPTGGGFFTGKTFDRIWCGNYFRPNHGKDIPWNTPIGNLMYEFAQNLVP